MATKPSKAKASISQLDASLVGVRLKKFAVEAFLTPDESGKGVLEIGFNISLHPTDNKNEVLVRLAADGDGKPELAANDQIKAFAVAAIIEGVFTLSRQPDHNELSGREVSLANILIPQLADMLETAVHKCGFLGVVVPRSLAQDDIAV